MIKPLIQRSRSKYLKPVYMVRNAILDACDSYLGHWLPMVCRWQQKFSIAGMIFSHTMRYMSRDMRFPTMWYVRPAKAQTSLCIRAVWPEPLLVAWKLLTEHYLELDRPSQFVSKCHIVGKSTCRGPYKCRYMPCARPSIYPSLVSHNCRQKYFFEWLGLLASFSFVHLYL